MSLSSGTRLGAYEIVGPLGAGGMGEVYRARDTRLGREVAVKVLAERLALDPSLRERFRQEGRAVALLSHPNILAIHDVGEEGGRAWSVTELLEGETLRQRLQSPMPLRKVLDIASQVVQGLAAAHEKGIVHRDLKPENLFVTRDGVVKILDFGLAKSAELRAEGGSHLSTAVQKTEPGTILGTVGYMSPEQVRGLAVDHRSDIFSFGSVLYEMLTGGRAYQRATAAETMSAILNEDPPQLSQLRRTLPAELCDVVAHCLEKRPEDRFQSTRDLAFALRVAEREESSAPARSGAVTPERPVPSIAVLPFRNLSADPENEYLSDGLTEEIIGALDRVASMRVASRTSSFAFKKRDEDVRRIGAQLGVTTVLEGSVRRSGNRIRVGAQLVNVADGYHLWSERFDREMADVFELQDDIARAIAETLKVKLLGAGDAPEQPHTDDVEAYNHYLKGRYFFNRRDARSAVRELERAIELDPGYAAAHTALCDAYCVYGFYGGIDTRVAYARSRAAAEKARELLPDSAEVHISLALIEHYFGWDVGKLERELKAALSIEPRSAAAYSWLSLGITFHGRAGEAREYAREACRLEPLSANFQANVGWTYYAEGDYPQALAEFRRALHIDPDALYPIWASGMTQRLLGKHDEAVASVRRAVEVTRGEQTQSLGLLGAVLAAAGQREEALAIRASLEERAAREYVAPLHLLPLLVELGDLDAAVPAFERAVAERNGLAWFVRTNPIFRPLWDDRRYASIASHIKPG